MTSVGAPRVTVPLPRLLRTAQIPVVAAAVEEARFDAVTVSDHVDNLVGPFTTLAAFARETSRVRLATLMVCSGRRPWGVVAQDALAVTLASEGRFELGIGAGWTSTEPGTALWPFAARLERLSEEIVQIRRWWLEHVPAEDSRTAFPRLWMGGWGPMMLAMAAETADVVSITSPPIERHGRSATSLADRIDLVRSGAARREIELSVRVDSLSIGDRPAEGDGDVAPDLRRVDRLCLSGPAEQTAATLRQLADAHGIDSFHLPLGRASLAVSRCLAGLGTGTMP